MVGWLTIGFLPTLGILELSYQMGKITGRKGERYPWQRGTKKVLT
jgi:hypothetical protein